MRCAGIAVVDGALPAEVVAALLAELQALRAAEQLRLVTVQASVGTRQDCVLYAAPGDPGLGSATERAMRLLKGVAAALASHAQSGGCSPLGGALPALAVPRNCMLALYPGSGAAYVAHRDNARRGSPSRNRRAVTAILYANRSDWDAERDGAAQRPRGGSCSACAV